MLSKRYNIINVKRFVVGTLAAVGAPLQMMDSVAENSRAMREIESNLVAEIRDEESCTRYIFCNINERISIAGRREREREIYADRFC